MGNEVTSLHPVPFACWGTYKTFDDCFWNNRKYTVNPFENQKSGRIITATF